MLGMIAIFPEIATKAARGDIENLAVTVRRYFGGRDTFAPSPDVAELVDNVGVLVQRVPFECNGALLARDERGAFEIIAVVREGTEAAAERFLLAHMLGHFLFDVQPLIAQGDWTVSGLREVVCPMRRYIRDPGVRNAEATVSVAERQKEARADDFAAALLMPKGMVQRACDKIGDRDRVAAFFGVPRACLDRRLSQLTRSTTPQVPIQTPVPSRDSSPQPASKRQSLNIFESRPDEPAKPDDASSLRKGVEKGMDRIRQIAKLLDKST